MLAQQKNILENSSQKASEDSHATPITFPSLTQQQKYAPFNRDRNDENLLSLSQLGPKGQGFFQDSNQSKISQLIPSSFARSQYVWFANTLNLLFTSLFSVNCIDSKINRNQWSAVLFGSGWHFECKPTAELQIIILIS